MLIGLLGSFSKNQQDEAIQAILNRARNSDVALMIFEQTGSLLAEEVVLDQLNERLEAIL